MLYSEEAVTTGKVINLRFDGTLCIHYPTVSFCAPIFDLKNYWDTKSSWSQLSRFSYIVVFSVSHWIAVWSLQIALQIRQDAGLKLNKVVLTFFLSFSFYHFKFIMWSIYTDSMLWHNLYWSSTEAINKWTKNGN